MMKIAFFVYPSAFQNKGGGEILLEKTEQYLLDKGIEVIRFDTWNDKIEDFDILHVFGSVKECLPLMCVAGERGTKVILESIFWSDFRRAFNEYGPVLKRSEMVLRHFVKVAFPFFPSARKKMFEVADLIFPNSHNEGVQISRLFNIPMKKMFVIPNGVDNSFSDAVPGPFIEKYGLKDFVLGVGRIEPRKNQLNLIKAVKNIGTELVLIGDAVSGYEWYRDLCVKEASERVHFIDSLPHGSDMLTSAYAACDTFVLPGWFETPGLAALEAALAGAKIIVTDGGSTREYFGDKVLYIEPHKPRDIKGKIKMSLADTATDDLKKMIQEKYLWQNVAERTVEGYRKVLSM